MDARNRASRTAWILLGAQLALLCTALACSTSHDVERAGADAGEARGAADTPEANAGSVAPEDHDEPAVDAAVAPEPTTCDPQRCAASAVGLGEACCTLDGKCGLNLQQMGFPSFCLERDAAGTPDSTCPSMSFQGLPIGGCCRAASGTCGLSADLLGLGCTLNPDALSQGCGPQ